MENPAQREPGAGAPKVVEDGAEPLRAHFTVAVYPFLHSHGASGSRTRWEQLSARWAPWWDRLSDEDVCRGLDNSYFFMPFIRDVVYPEARLLERRSPSPGDGYEYWLPVIRSLSKSLPDLATAVFGEGVLRLTCRGPELRGAALEVFPSGVAPEAAIPARLEWLDVLLFPLGVGFLVFKLALDDAAPRLASLLDLNYSIRTVQPPAVGWRLPVVRWGPDGAARPLRECLDFLLEGLAAEFPAGKPLPPVGALFGAGALPVVHRVSETVSGQVYGERCQILSFAALEAAPAGDSLRGEFSSVEDRLLFEFACSLGTGDAVRKPEWVPSPEQLAQLEQEHRIALWRCWRGMALKESVVFLGTEPVRFNHAVLPRNIEGDYLPLYLFTLYQKYQLLVFANELVRRTHAVTKGSRRARVRHLPEVRRLMERFVRFRNRFWFNEVTRKPFGGELYRKFQRGLEVPQLYEMVSAEVQCVQEFYETRHQRRVDLLLNWFTFVFIPVGAVIGLFSVQNVYWPLCLAVCAGVLAVSGALWWWWSRE